MTTKPEPAFYSPLPTEPTPNYVVLPLYPPRRRRLYNHHLRRYILPSLSLLLLCIAAFLLWPSDPDLELVRVSLNHIQFHNSHSLSLDLSLSLTLRVRNRDFFSLDYKSLTVSIGYRGRELGFVRSNGGKLRARGSSYVNATLLVDGFEVLHDIVYLIGDIASGSVPFDTVSMVKGQLGLYVVNIPIQTKVSCEIYINPVNQTLVRQNCYPE